MNKIKQSILSIVIGLALAGGISFAWTGPAADPTGANTPAPINVSTNPQTFGNSSSAGSKLLNMGGDGSGALSINGGLGVHGVALFDGNVGIGFDDAVKQPEAKLHVAGGDAIFEGQIQIRGGLPEKDKVLTAVDDTGSAAWKRVTADMLVPEGYEEMYYNTGEDIYGKFTGNDSYVNDTCDGDFMSAYSCLPGENKVCKDTINPDPSGDQRLNGVAIRNVQCKAVKILRKNMWQYVEHKYTGTAVITNIDHDSDNETCVVDVNFSTEQKTCSWQGKQSPNLNELSLAKCRDWLFGAIRSGEVCTLPFPQNKIAGFSGSWDMKTSKDFGEGWVANGTGALNLSFTELK